MMMQSAGAAHGARRIAVEPATAFFGVSLALGSSLWPTGVRANDSARQSRQGALWSGVPFNGCRRGRWVHRYLIMADHVRLIFTSRDSTTWERSVQPIKGGSSREIGKRPGPRFPIWQAGFTRHQIPDQRDFDSHVSYIDEHPVRARLSETPDGYRWGSAAGKFRLESWPVASGAMAPTNPAGLKPRPSESTSSESASSQILSSKSSRSESRGKVGE